MERDVEMLIRKKVMNAEKQPVAWRKERVWSAVSNNLQQPARSTPVYYYIAAAACVAIMIAAVIYVQIRQYDFALESRIVYLKNELDKAKAARAAQDINPVLATESCEEKTIAFKSAPEKRAPVSRATTPTTSDTLSSIAVAIDTTEKSLVVATSSLTTDKRPSRKKREYVKPIIGDYDTSFSVTPLVQKKKSKIRWFNNPEKENTKFQDEPNAKTITARIN
jgi:hypothetical protein